MFGNPGIGFGIIEEAARFAPGAERAGGKVEVVRPFRDPAHDADGFEKRLVAPRREDRALVEQRSKIGFAGETIGEGDAKAIPPRGRIAVTFSRR